MLETQRQETISRNLAGAGLAGFKGQHLQTHTFRQELSQLGDSEQDGVYGVDRATTLPDFSQGAVTHTGRALDFALTGPGFFQVQGPDGRTLLTRNGGFALSPTGILVTQEGYPGPIRFDAADNVDTLEAAEDGQLRVSGLGGPRTVGTLRVGTVDAPEQMTRISANYFVPAANQTLNPAQGVSVSNGYQEQANVSPVREMAAMIQSLRDFESGQKMVQTLMELSRDENQKME
jgi:flagellar basal body rod protein FlgG